MTFPKYPKLFYLSHWASTRYQTQPTFYTMKSIWDQDKHWITISTCLFSKADTKWPNKGFCDFNPDENNMLVQDQDAVLCFPGLLTDMDKRKKRIDDATIHWQMGHTMLWRWMAEGAHSLVLCYLGSSSLTSMLRVPGISRLCQCHLL